MSSKNSKKLVGGVIRRRTLIIISVIFLGFLFYPTIRNYSTSFEAMVVEKISGTEDFVAKKGAVRHADFKEIILCNENGKEFEKFVENAVFNGLKEGAFVEKKYFEDKLRVVNTVKSADKIKNFCTIHPPRPKQEGKDGGIK